MKILHIYAGNLFGGIETLLVTLAKQQNLCPQMKHHFALCFEGRLASELRNVGIRVNMLGNVRVSRPWTIWKARLQLQKLFKQEQFDVVICHACWSEAIFGSVVKANSMPLIFWCHDTPNGRHWLEKWAKQILPNLVITNSNYTQNAVSKLYPQIPSHTLYLPVSPPEIDDAHGSIRRAVRAELNTPDDAVVIIQASRLEEWKGQTVLLSALSRLRDVPNWICWIAGGAQRSHEVEYLQALQTQATELGISDRVCFLGQRTDVPHLLAAADIHCQPNTAPEPFGIAFIEALYAGLPVLTTAIGGAVEIVDESCGRMVAANDTASLSNILETIIANPDERATLAQGGRSRAEYLCNPVKQLTQLYNLISPFVEHKVII